MASRIHGQHGALYVDISSAANGSAVLVATLVSSKRSFNTDTLDVTAYEDSNHVYVAGKPDGTGSYGGFIATTYLSIAPEGESCPCHHSDQGCLRRAMRALHRNVCYPSQKASAIFMT